MCAAVPEICTDIFAPVCGCDGVTYPNACYAARAGAAIAREGECAPAPAPFCGGITGIPCAGSATCVDDPSDSCDPAQGGADCSGICQCVENVLCVRGAHFDSSPSVCACVPDVTDPCSLVRCAAGTHCVANGSTAACEADGAPCGAISCAPSQVCCNASCGICTPPGGVCIQIACN